MFLIKNPNDFTGLRLYIVTSLLAVYPLKRTDPVSLLIVIVNL